MSDVVLPEVRDTIIVIDAVNRFSLMQLYVLIAVWLRMRHPRFTLITEVFERLGPRLLIVFLGIGQSAVEIKDYRFDITHIITTVRGRWSCIRHHP